MSSSVAVVTGTTSGIGEAVATKLLNDGWTVHGIARRAATIASPRYRHHQADLTHPSALESLVADIQRESDTVHALINNAGVGHFAPHEELSTQAIQEMIALNLTAPLLLTRGLLRAIKRSEGWVINISSFSAHESSSFGAAYAATKAGLQHFGDSLFDEVRKSGAKVATIAPDITRTAFFDSLTFSPEDDEAAAVTPQCIADTVSNILSQRNGTVITNVIVRPQRLMLRKGKREQR